MINLTKWGWGPAAASIFLLLLLVAGHSHGQSSEREVGKLMDEYMSPKTGGDRRDAIRAQLKDEDPMLMQRSVKKFLKDKECRKMALDIAAELRVPGLTAEVLKLEKELEQETLEYLFRTQEGKTPLELLARWNKAEPDSLSYQWLSDRFRRNYVPLDLLPAFRDKLEDANRGEAALAVLRFQLSDPDAEPDAIRKGWDERLKRLTKEGQVFAVSGKRLFSMPWNMEVLTPVRTNYLLPSEKHLFLNDFPADWTKRSLSIKLAVLPGEASCIEVAFTTEDLKQTATFNYSPDRWFIKFTTGETAEKPVKRTEWSSLELKVINEGSDKDWNRRRCYLLVNGEELKIAGICYTLNAPLRKLTINTQASSHSILIAGGEWMYEGK